MPVHAGGSTIGLATQDASKPSAVTVLSVTSSTNSWLVVDVTSAGSVVPVRETSSGAVASAPSYTFTKSKVFSMSNVRKDRVTESYRVASVSISQPHWELLS